LLFVLIQFERNAMARLKNIEAFCNSCNVIQKMEITADFAGEANKKWAKCKKCKQLMIIDLNEIKTNTKPVLDGIENEDCTVYSPGKSFKIGEAIYHQDWDDFGKVVSKDTLSNGHHSISVEFQKSGYKKLIESLNNQ